MTICHILPGAEEFEKYIQQYLAGEMNIHVLVSFEHPLSVMLFLTDDPDFFQLFSLPRSMFTIWEFENIQGDRVDPTEV